ncbi:DUF445 domain-containing protein [Chitinophagaceae bacterium MMS25-I14]
MMQNIMFYLQPVVAAFTGWFTTWIAIYMLFHPREPKRFLGITIQGVFPKRKQQFAEKMGSIVANELLHFREIAQHITDPGQLAALKPGIEQHVDTFLQVRLKEKMPMIAMFAGESTLAKIKEGLLEEIDLMLPDVIGQYADNLEQKIDIHKIVSEKVSGFSTDKLEELMLGIMSKEFRFVEVIGAVLGFMIGLIQMLLALV